MLRLLLCYLTLLLTDSAIAQSRFQEAFNDSSRPGIKNIRIPLSDSQGNESHLPISIIKGKKTGPVFTIVAGVHGFEYPPIVATQALMKEIDPQKLKGTLVVIPVASLGAFYARTPFTSPEDQVNLNNAFPGSPSGSITQQKAHFITKNIIPVSDVFLDIHGGDAPEDLLPFICYYNNTRKRKETALAKKLCEESGFQYVVSYPYTISATDPAKYAFKQAVQDGKTALSIESGKLGTVTNENIDLIKKGVYNMLAVMQMYPGGRGAHPNIVYRNSQTYVKSTVQGIFYARYKAGDMVKKGDIIGHTTDEFGVLLEEYTAPKDGIVLYNLATPPINVNTTVMCISSFEEE
ncbi:MAG: succinylglutamate desuccinylase/aspartoacylase family protein [Bacteroidota bacterium]